MSERISIFLKPIWRVGACWKNPQKKQIRFFVTSVNRDCSSCALVACPAWLQPPFLPCPATLQIALLPAQNVKQSGKNWWHSWSHYDSLWQFDAFTGRGFLIYCTPVCCGSISGVECQYRPMALSIPTVHRQRMGELRSWWSGDTLLSATILWSCNQVGRGRGRANWDFLGMCIIKATFACIF